MAEQIIEMEKWLDNETLVAKDKIISSTCATADDVAAAASAAEEYANTVAEQAASSANSYTDSTASTLQKEIDQILAGDVDLSQYVDWDSVGAAGGVAPLDDAGLIDAQYLPSYVDDVIVCDTKDDFPTEGEDDKIYVAADTGDVYRWADGAGYIQISQSVATADEAVHAETASKAEAYSGGKVGDQASPVYIDEDGKPATCDMGFNSMNADQGLLVGVNSSGLGEIDDTVGSASVPVYLNEGKIAATTGVATTADVESAQSAAVTAAAEYTDEAVGNIKFPTITDMYINDSGVLCVVYDE